MGVPFSSCGPNTWALLANGDGCASARRRRLRRYRIANAVSRLAPTKAPTMVPAIVPPCDFLGLEMGLEELSEVADGVDGVDEVAIVEDETGVASGGS